MQTPAHELLHLLGLAHAKADRHRLVRDHVVHDRQVMDSEIPHDADIALEKAEVHTNGVVVVQVAELTLGHEVVDLANGARVDECVIDHEGQSARIGNRDELVAFG